MHTRATTFVQTPPCPIHHAPIDIHILPTVYTQVWGSININLHPQHTPSSQRDCVQIYSHHPNPGLGDKGVRSVYTPYTTYVCLYTHIHTYTVGTYLRGYAWLGGEGDPRTLRSTPRPRSLWLSSSRQAGAQDQARAARAPPPIPEASGRGEPQGLGRAWPEPCAAPLPSRSLWRVSLALEVSPLGFNPGEVEEEGGGRPGCWLAVGSRCQQ